LLLLPKLAVQLPFLARIEAKYNFFTPRSKSRLFGTLLVSVLIWIMSFLAMLAAYNFSGLPALTIGQLFLIFILSTFSLIISITPGSIGIYEGSIVGVLVSYGVDWNAALAFAVGFRFCVFILPIIIALATLSSDGERLLKMYKGKSV
jgi:uncharacterized protein (TIRG00374 family)